MKRKTQLRSILYISMTLFCSRYVFAETWTTLDKPGASDTEAMSIDGSNIVGWYKQNDADHGFLYDGTTWTLLDAPGAQNTYATGISGNNIVGFYRDSSNVSRGFILNGSNWETLEAPGATMTYITGVDGSRIAGYYIDSSEHNYGFIYDGQTFTSITPPGSSDSWVTGIFGNKVFGIGTMYGSFSYDYIEETWTPIESFYDNLVYPIDSDGTKIVGWTAIPNGTGDEGIIYDGSTWTTLNMPGAISTRAWGIYGDNIVGGYVDSTSYYHGFIYIPEPATALLICSGLLFIRKRR